MNVVVLNQDHSGKLESRIAPRPAHRSADARQVRALRYRYVQGLPGIEVVSVAGASSAWSELHDTFTVCTVERGAPVSYRCNGRPLMRCPSVGMLIGPGEVHVDAATPGPSDYRILRITPCALARAATRLGLPSANLTVAEHEIASAASNDLFLSLHVALESGRKGAANAAICRLLDACIAEIVRRCTACAPRAAERREIGRAREFVRNNLHEPLTLVDMAAAAGMGKWGFSALFRDCVGLPPHQYVVHMRLARARSLLATGRPCCEVAFDVGFFDQSHLNRWFARAYGVSPGEYQRTLVASVTSSPSNPAPRRVLAPREASLVSSKPVEIHVEDARLVTRSAHQNRMPVGTTSTSGDSKGSSVSYEYK